MEPTAQPNDLLETGKIPFVKYDDETRTLYAYNRGDGDGFAFEGVPKHVVEKMEGRKDALEALRIQIIGYYKWRALAESETVDFHRVDFGSRPASHVGHINTEGDVEYTADDTPEFPNDGVDVQAQQYGGDNVNEAHPEWSRFFQLTRDAKAAPAGDDILDECLSLAEMLIEKNRRYGNSALDPVRVFSDASPVEQILVRMDDKLSRIKSAQGDDDEDPVNDLLGYLILLRLAKRDDV